jgi:hypothetical protein
LCLTGFEPLRLGILYSISHCYNCKKIYEPRHNKTNIMGLRTAWIQTRLRSLIRIHAVRYQFLVIGSVSMDLAGWSGSMLVANPLCWFCHDAAHIFTYEFTYFNMPTIISVRSILLVIMGRWFDPWGSISWARQNFFSMI